MKKVLFVFVFASLSLSAFSQNEPSKIKLVQPSAQKNMVSDSKVNPLLVIDGKIMEVKDSEEYNKIMNSGDVNEIFSVDVLKDKNAVAIYGEKGKNGVVVITSKKYKAFQEKQKNTEGVKD
jgi:TonB-dependent SusC/RagA subfamily outer membrane receptor